MRFAVGILLALAIGSPCAAAINVEVPPTVVVPELEAGATAAPVSFTRMAASLADGQAFAEFREGCLIPSRSEPLRWRSSMNSISDPEFSRIFRMEFNKAGFKVSGDPSNLFQNASEATDLQIGALITDFRVKSCYNDSMAAGKAVLDVEWQIYSTTADKVIARIPTRGGVTDVERANAAELVIAVLQQAFTENVRQLAANPSFRGVVLDPRFAAAATPPEGPLQVTYQSEGKALPLKDAATGAVTIFAGSAMGSGVLISANGYILTNHHVAGTSGRVRVHWSDGVVTAGVVLRGDRRRDVALIKVDSPRGRPLAVRRAPVALGETVFAIGTPLRDELQNTLTRGIVSGVRTMDGQSFIQSDTPITHGNSGGPLLDDKGSIVGLSDLGTDPSLGSTINFFIPINDALKVLALSPAG
jgi:S1-C subfamily serine protease